MKKKFEDMTFVLVARSAIRQFNLVEIERLDIRMDSFMRQKM